jgi:hypothetical protein
MSWPPRASIECTDHMLVYEPNKPSSLTSIEGGFTPLLQWLAQERKWVRSRGLVSRRAVDCVGSSFSREQWLCPSLLTTS